MAPAFEEHPSQQDPTAQKEPLVDINTESTPAGESGAQVKPRRKRLSDIQGQTDEISCGPKPQRRCLSDVAQAQIEGPSPARPSPRTRPRLAVAPAPTAVMEMPDDSGTVPIYDGAPGCTEPDATAPAPQDATGGEQPSAELQDKQSCPVAAAGGLLAAVGGAMLWAVVTTMTNLHIAWMAIVVGLLVSSVVRVLGRGLDKSFGWLGAALVLLGCLLGSHLTNCMLIAREAELSTTAVLARGNPLAIVRLTIDTFHPLDILFYGLAVYEGYRLSFQRIPKVQSAQPLTTAGVCQKDAIDL
jgi:hypothetical protein